MREKIISILIILFGFGLLSYPFFSNYLFEKSAGSTIKTYQQSEKTYDQKKKEQEIQKAERYNELLTRSTVELTDPFKAKKTDGETAAYNNILNLDRSGVMGYLNVPCININLPIYHGTEAEILEKGVGHLAASSLPVGGKSTHSILTGHTGLSSAKLFTDLTEMKKGDYFFIHVLDKTLAYQVDQISIVLPEDTKKLQIINGKDYVTLVTCTPYGVNDHRLLVRGVRTTYHKKDEHIKARAHHSQWMDILIMISILCFLYPEISSSFDDIRSDKVITDIQKYPKKKKAQLYQKASEYNQKIYESGQNELKDVWSYRSAPIKLTKGQKTFGYVQIPKMKVKLPLYLGATMENLRRGAAIMGQTSLPLGQVNGNCVIAAHRGYQGIPYFRDIERLKIGDKVYLRNPWKKMKYRVQKIQIIDPYDTDKIKIQKGKDMITLLTCHPYRGHGKYRYLVYCVRDHGQKIKKKTKKTSFLSSEKDIEKEIFMRYIGLFMICLVGFGMILRRRR